MRWLDGITDLMDLSLSELQVHALEKEMATHSSVLAWRIPGTAEPGGMPSLGSHRVGHDCQGIFPMQGLNLGILIGRLTLNHLSHQGRPMYAEVDTISSIRSS